MKSIATSRGKYWKRIFRNAALCSTTMSSLVHFWNVMTPTVAKRHKACQIEPKKPVFHFVTYCHLLGLLRPPGLFEEKKWKKKSSVGLIHKKIMKNGLRFAKPCCLTSATRIYLNGALKFKGQFVADFHLVRLVFWQNRPPTNFCLIKLQLVL